LIFSFVVVRDATAERCSGAAALRCRVGVKQVCARFLVKLFLKKVACQGAGLLLGGRRYSAPLV